MKRFLAMLTLVTFVATNAGAAGAAGDDDLEAVLVRLDERSAGVTDLEATFTQEKHTAILRRPLVSKGSVRVRPPLVRWDTERPHASSMLVSRTEVRIYYPDQAIVEIYEMTDQLGQIAASPIFRLVELREHFVVDRAKPRDDVKRREDERPVAGRVELRLTPRAKSLREHVHEIRLSVEERTGIVRRAEIVDPDGERMVLTFDRVKINPALKPETLVLDVPADVREVRPLATGNAERGGGGT